MIVRAFSAFLLINYLAIFAIAYFNFNQSKYIRKSREKQLFNETIKQQSKLVLTYNRQIVDSILQLYNSPLNMKLRRHERLAQTDKLLAMRELNSFVTGSEYLLSAYVYNPAYGMLSSDDNFESTESLSNFKDKEVIHLLTLADKKSKTSLQLLPYLRLYPDKSFTYEKLLSTNKNRITVLEPEQAYVFTYVLKEGESALVVNVDAAYLIKIMQTNLEQSVLLRMLNGAELLISTDENLAKYIANKNLHLSTVEQADFVNYKLANNEYLCAKLHVKALACDLVYFIPDNTIFADVYTLKNRTYLLLATILIIFVVLHIWLWKRVVNPFAEAVSEVGKLDKFSVNPAKVLKYLRQQQFWQSIFSGTYAHNLDFNFVKAAKQLDLCFNSDQVFLILLADLAMQRVLEEQLQVSKLQFVRVEFMDRAFYVVDTQHELLDGPFTYNWPRDIRQMLNVSLDSTYYSKLYQAQYLQKAVYHLVEMQKLNQLGFSKIYAEDSLLKLTKAQGDLSTVSSLFSNLLNQDIAVNVCFDEFIDSLSNYRLSSILYILQNLLLQLSKKIGELGEQTTSNLQDQFNELVSNDFDLLDLKKFFLPILELYRQLKLAQHQEQVSNLSEDVVEFIMANLQDYNLSLKLVAAEFKLNPTYLSKLFKEAKNITISAYITQKRMQKAAWLLTNSEMSNKQICAKIGIENSSYFYALFKKAYSLTPNEYKLVCKQSDVKTS